MRVECKTIDAFLYNLERDAEKVFRQIVYVDATIRNPINELRIERGIQASAVIELEDGGQYLLDYGEIVGIDSIDDPPDLSGSEAVTSRVGRITELCEKKNLEIRPGVVAQ